MRYKCNGRKQRAYYERNNKSSERRGIAYQAYLERGLENIEIKERITKERLRETRN